MWHLRCIYGNFLLPHGINKFFRHTQPNALHFVVQRNTSKSTSSNAFCCQVIRVVMMIGRKVRQIVTEMRQYMVKSETGVPTSVATVCAEMELKCLTDVFKSAKVNKTGVSITNYNLFNSVAFFSYFGIGQPNPARPKKTFSIWKIQLELGLSLVICIFRISTLWYAKDLYSV